ncbi:hypothetical protein [Escherichia coli]|uniref:hypothetical protein n=1 Tax=Escherichia coli TaxID=562 RepID=UPI001CBE602E|nr:hypothetical protein [Escherichia coli]MCD9134158.1 hypothetical protein [Escherichia coli]
MLDILKKTLSVNHHLINLKRIIFTLFIPLPGKVIIVMLNSEIQGKHRLYVLVISCRQVNAFEHLKIMAAKLNAIIAIQPSTQPE